jgi:hypothetical protein
MPQLKSSNLKAKLIAIPALAITTGVFSTMSFIVDDASLSQLLAGMAIVAGTLFIHLLSKSQQIGTYDRKVKNN